MKKMTQQIQLAGYIRMIPSSSNLGALQYAYATVKNSSRSILEKAGSETDGFVKLESCRDGGTLLYVLHFHVPGVFKSSDVIILFPDTGAQLANGAPNENIEILVKGNLGPYGLDRLVGRLALRIAVAADGSRLRKEQKGAEAAAAHPA